MMRWAVNEYDGPVAVRYPRGNEDSIHESSWDNGSVVTCRHGNDGLIVTYGTLANASLKAAALLAENGIDISVMRLLEINPIPLDSIRKIFNGQKHIVIAEESSFGIAKNLAWHMQQMAPDAIIQIVDLGDHYITHGNTQVLYQHCGIDAESLAKTMMEVRKIEK